jgi:hypothetical protein
MKRTRWVIASMVALALIGAACSTADETAAPTPSDATNAVDGSKNQNVSAETGAAELRATLTAALQEHEYLAGTTVYAAVNTGLESPVTKAASAALDENTKALGAAIGSVYGGDAEKAFLPLWRKHIGFFVDYTVGGVTKDKAKQAAAKKALDGYRGDFGAFLASANPNLTKEAVADALVPHVTSTFAAIDAVVAKDPKAFELLREGAAKLAPVADVLAGAIVKQFPDKFSGSADSGASSLRSTLHGALQEHEYLAGISVFNAVNFGLDDKNTKGAMAALDENTKALGAAIGSVYGGDAEKAFIPLWRKHIGFFVDYTVGGVKKDAAMQAEAKEALDGYRSDFGAFLASANPNLTKDAVADALVPHVTSTFDAIDSVVAKKSDQFEKLRQGAAKLGPVATVLADAIAKQFPEKFA